MAEEMDKLLKTINKIEEQADVTKNQTITKESKSVTPKKVKPFSVKHVEQEKPLPGIKNANKKGKAKKKNVPITRKLVSLKAPEIKHDKNVEFNQVYQLSDTDFEGITEEEFEKMQLKVLEIDTNGADEPHLREYRKKIANEEKRRNIIRDRKLRIQEEEAEKEEKLRKEKLERELALENERKEEQEM
jgi:hypothetical protein